MKTELLLNVLIQIKAQGGNRDRTQKWIKSTNWQDNGEEGWERGRVTDEALALIRLGIHLAVPFIKMEIRERIWGMGTGWKSDCRHVKFGISMGHPIGEVQ